ncbi:PIF1 helicase-like protein [Beauveria brongniartii RCEF 3172]|uniref:PIF1 helicase-like protein n=1 Tax=Beauveria brongniartii RCEF 3172 TaxID=1081107 RepID=A0A162JPQ3_9HYPO|nr:PIF1 helicase-like protein [Beauveria brongniartii RCEF 3172]
MAHIATCMAAVEPTTITKPSSPLRAMFASGSPPKHSGKSSAAHKSAQAEQPQRYQLFPKDKPLPTPNTLAPTKALPTPQASETSDKTSPLAGIRIRLNQNNLIRRRKVSVPELGPMTTVQEVSMDSPTIPGRPPLHERASSAPDESSSLVAPIDQTPKTSIQTEDLTRAIEGAFELPATKPRPSSPRKLTPLVIPPSNAPAPRLQSKHSSSQLRSGSSPPAETSRPGRLELGTPSIGRLTPASTPDLSIPQSATATELSTSTLPTPISAAPTDQKSSPRLWESYTLSNEDCSLTANTPGHRRTGSETSSTMDRGRQSKRNEKVSKTGDAKSTHKSSERRAFEELPTGWRPCEAISKLNANDVMALHKQALGQAERFEVLRVEDVEALSKELRQLDDRTEYLRRTYSSLRAGRRNLHSRICQYLRSPRVAKFSHDSMLKQEEALAELDASIDDWVTKLEQAENRRTRVRQKLLEHVAAAAILPVPDGSVSASSPYQTHGGASPPLGIRDVSTPPRSPTKQTCTTSSPRTGSNSPSPQRVVAQVPSTILELPLMEEQQAASAKSSVGRSASTATTKSRKAVESIRVYAGDDLYALLADVEDEIFRLGSGQEEQQPMPVKPLKEQVRNRSQEKLDGDGTCNSTAADTLTAATTTTTTTTTTTATTTTPPPAVDAGNAPPSAPPARAGKKDFLKEAQMLLSNTVFRP